MGGFLSFIIWMQALLQPFTMYFLAGEYDWINPDAFSSKPEIIIGVVSIVCFESAKASER